MNIERAATETGLSADTIRFYEWEGVLPPAPRLANGYRHYSEAHLATLRLARGLRELDLPLPAVAALVRVAHDGECGEVKAALVEQLAVAKSELDARMRELRATRTRITELVAALETMPAEQGRVPGLDACGCVDAVGRAP